MIVLAAVAGIIFIRNEPLVTDVTEKTTCVGLILPGKHDDCSFSQTHFDALESISDELNLRIIYKEYVSDEDSYDEIIDLINNEGCKVIVSSSFGYGENTMKAAMEYPELCFLHATGTESLNNLSSYMGRMYQVRYLSGIVAGMRTDTGEIGYVAAFPIPEVIRGINAFALGVRSVREDAVIHVDYCDSWTEDESAKETAIGIFDKYPVDVVTLHTDSVQPLVEADKRGIWSVGYNMDNSDMFPDTYLTACEWHWDVYYHEQILKYLQGKFHGTHDWINMEDGIVRLSGLTSNVAEGTEEAVEKAKKRLESREFDVFYGPIRDEQGKIRVEEGESMADDEILNSFDWYVEGVQVER